MKVSDRLTADRGARRAGRLAGELARADWRATASRAAWKRVPARPARFGVIAYGKLGGLELGYGSDLDLVFVHDSAGEQQETDAAEPLDNSVFFGRLTRRIIHVLTVATAAGQSLRGRHASASQRPVGAARVEPGSLRSLPA